MNDRVNEIGWGSLPPPSPNSSYFEAGLTQLSYDHCAAACNTEERASILEADITIEADPPLEFQSTRCLLGTLLHEVGHLLGLEHLPAPAIMEAETSTCILALTDADRDALDARYGLVTGAPVTRSTTESSVDGGGSDEAKVADLVRHQFDLFKSHSWDDVYSTYSPRFQALCPITKFRTVNEEGAASVGVVDVSNVVVRVDRDRAYVTYTYVRQGTPLASIDEADPDVYVKIKGVWYDDIDDHTNCSE